MSIDSGWPLADRRTAQQLERDTAAVREQVRKLSTANGSADARLGQRRVIERIQRRAAAPFLRLAAATDDERSLLAAADQLVVDADDERLAGCADLLGGFTPADSPGRSAHRRTRVLAGGSDTSGDQLRVLARRLREERGIPANLNAIVPLGYVIKGDSYPAVTVAPAEFAAGAGTARVRVAVIDTGVTAVARRDGWDTGVVREGVDPLDEVAPKGRIDWFGGHGTFATGIVRQLAPGCEIVVHRFTGSDGVGTDEAAADTMIRAAEEAVADGVRLVISASFGAPAVDGVPPLAMQEAVAWILDRRPGTLIVASAGNDGEDLRLYPAAFPGVKAVGALNADLSPASFSNRGDWVHCSAVGVGVVSTFVEGKLPPEENLGADVLFGADSWAAWSGTSFTAPQISGAVAALCGEDAALTPQRAFDRLLAGRPVQPGLGATVHLLPGTPV